uniref:Uncharacterized protein n=1 Tax=Arundo donax TaxID=35708 RepID=A0A0A8Y9T8_ARUDO
MKLPPNLGWPASLILYRNSETGNFNSKSLQFVEILILSPFC